MQMQIIIQHDISFRHLIGTFIVTSLYMLYISYTRHFLDTKFHRHDISKTRHFIERAFHGQDISQTRHRNEIAQAPQFMDTTFHRQDISLTDISQKIRDYLQSPCRDVLSAWPWPGPPSSSAPPPASAAPTYPAAQQGLFPGFLQKET